ncbi:hypothetical protein [Bradyrhizobium elkanii]|uniref:Uncharacterized protein n=1 Tax=Bradyrhizobium elkanii TaxID=29448 RepID=A0ABV4F9H1_BRAEL|nr:hypothetical protein [Bradyrhizobium elkanii]MCP1751189.1 hypothetical protein [Bradyrhizobium elkanii]MCP1976961.1 hypothetical protein [Bradyrhizobium elkanii]MCS3888521.1 hypothetical protein [Bradyrhizobium elkanii]MCS4212457.1 hypothetical protein [Bradyrhizobium elkanii]MCW2191908.1 hypothetical protein [Bradyrhizobium elkanii]
MTKMIQDDINAMPFSGVNAHTGGDPAMVRLQKVTAETVIDGSDRVPQFKPANGILVKGPARVVHTDQEGISQAQTLGTSSKRGKGGKMGKEWE